jgi:hypothetical protein
MIALLAADVLVVLAGHGLLRLAGGGQPIRRLGVLGAGSLSVLSGATLLGLATTVAGVLGRSTRPWPLLVTVLVVLAAAGLLPERGARRPADGTGDRRPTRVGDIAGAVVSAAVGLRLAGWVAGLPVWHTDEAAVWAYRGRLLSLAGHLDPRAFLGVQVLYPTRDYPLLVPALIAWSDAWLGRPADGPARLQLAALLVAMLMVTGWAVTRLAGSFAAVAAVLTVAAMPGGLSHVAVLLTADLTLLAFALPLVLVLALWVRTGERMQLAGAAVLAAGAASTKAEGLLFALAAMAAAGLVAPSARARLRLAIAAAAAAAAAAPWVVFTQLHGVESSVINGDTLSPASLRRTLPMAGAVATAVADHWPGSPALVALLLVPAALLAAARGQRRLLAQIAVTAAIATAGLYAQYVISVQGTGAAAATYIERHFWSTAHRVLLFPAVLCALAVPLLAGAARRTAASDQPPPDTAEPPVDSPAIRM